MPGVVLFKGGQAASRIFVIVAEKERFLFIHQRRGVLIECSGHSQELPAQPSSVFFDEPWWFGIRVNNLDQTSDIYEQPQTLIDYYLFRLLRLYYEAEDHPPDFDWEAGQTCFGRHSVSYKEINDRP